ncbi:hypothetical protein LJC68_05590, partial [Bacteroidales bacterium OttesenSCG-928-B11]|nr:hypothetical protein [Bacteroidales bacterium OttesenSCG-928-B11]
MKKKFLMLATTLLMFFGNSTMGQGTIDAFRTFPISQVRDCKRSPGYPGDGQSCNLYDFIIPKDATQGAQWIAISTLPNYDSEGYLQFDWVNSTSYKLKLNLYNCYGELVKTIAVSGRIAFFFDEGFAYFGDGGTSGTNTDLLGYVFFYNAVSYNSITVMAHTLPLDRTIVEKATKEHLYNVELAPTYNGRLTASKYSLMEERETVTLTPTPNTGYGLASITAHKKGDSNVPVTLTPGTGNTYTFDMPNYNVWVTAVFERLFPTVGNISSPISKHEGDAYTLSTPNVTAGKSPTTVQGWQVSSNGTSDWIAFDASGEALLSHNNLYLRYYATNSYGTAYSNTARIYVTGLAVGNITQPIWNEGGVYSLSAPVITEGKYTPTTQGWQTSINGVDNWVEFNGVDFTANKITHDGLYLRYFVTDATSGTVYSNVVQILVLAKNERLMIAELWDTYDDSWDGGGTLLVKVNGENYSITDLERSASGKKVHIILSPGDKVEFFWGTVGSAVSERALSVYWEDNEPLVHAKTQSNSFIPSADPAYIMQSTAAGKNASGSSWPTNTTTELWSKTMKSWDGTTLEELTVSQGTLIPEFDKDTYVYYDTVGYVIKELDITMRTTSADATVLGDTGKQVVSIGGNAFVITVNDKDNIHSQTYTVNVYRKSNDTTLRTLTVNSENVKPTLSSGVFVYYDTVSYATTSLIIAATANHPGAVVAAAD